MVEVKNTYKIMGLDRYVKEKKNGVWKMNGKGER